MASRFVPVSPRFDHVFGISPELSWCASVALHISKAGSSRFAIKSCFHEGIYTAILHLTLILFFFFISQLFFFLIQFYVPFKMSRDARKPDNCLCVNKDADQLRGNREADQRLCFRYSDSTVPPLLNSKISSF